MIGSTFASKTTRQPKISQTPGPGSYINDNTGVHRIIKNIPESFGSTSVKRPNFLNTSVDAPYSEPSYLENPGAGSYGPSKYDVAKKIKLPGKIGHMRSNEFKFKSIGKQSPFLSTDVRPCLGDEVPNEMMPGPGAYDLNFKDELKTLGKLSKLYFRSKIFSEI